MSETTPDDADVDADVDDADAAANEAGSPDDAGPARREAMADAVREVRREAAKAAVVSSAVDAAVATLLANVAFRVVELPVESSVSLGFLPRVDPGVSVHAAVPLALAVGLLVGVAEYLILMREPPVEQFEAVNPSVAEALRTARDLVADDGNPNRDSRMSVALYDDVLSRLRESSSVELLPTRRIVGALVVALLLSAGSIQVAISDIQFDGLAGDAASAGGGPDRFSDEETRLQNGSSILGDPEDVAAGSEQLNATVAGTGGSGDGDGPDSSAAAYDSTGYGGDGAVESQRAGYLADDTLEEADLIRDYSLEIRENEDE
ncbi:MULTISPECIES: hypothetical protein [unclassified Haloferax]|uniref:DUF7502 family protein n=1 Tax=unclassified Haloferax TaxID=2625095 RepID=UPI00287443A7|nr:MULTISPECIES: hypothetical protein [unclassified Haloferax]MDS0240143.1 hypothetical protein [Haloferax sp. S2CR25]MDS0443264.1 hypothetical protein [Haloferax sp. S2CR25-2]